MITQTSYPVFTSGQVLTSRHLNDLAVYLEQQDRMTRSKTIGIGIVCGFDLDLQALNSRLQISGGCAITSQGHLIVEQDSVLTHYRDYTLPVAKAGDQCAELTDQTPYSFFVHGNGNQRLMWELLSEGYVPEPGEPAPTPLSTEFLADKVVLLFLECTLESLKSCDINDCSDKGCQQTFTLRKLLVGVGDAGEIRAVEHQIAGRPVDRNKHPRYDLKELTIEKINPSANQIDTFEQLFGRIQALWNNLAADAATSLGEAYEAYKYMLADMYPVDRFQNGPFGDPGYLYNVEADNLNNIILVQYVYDYAYDLVQSHNEFLRAACLLDVECCPNSERYPKHLFLGIPRGRPKAFGTSLGSLADAQNFDPGTADSGLKPRLKPAPFRHHFVPSELYGRGRARLDEVRSLHYRTYLLAYRYDTDGLMRAPVRITPSKNGGHALSEKALPFYYNFQPNDDLHRNWSFEKTTKNNLDAVYSHQFINEANHPLKRKLEDHAFYRVEGIVGRPLGSTMRELLRQKRGIGLSFGIEPVFIGLSMKDDRSSTLLEKQALAGAQLALRKLMLCRMRDLDVVFLVLMALLFYFLFVIIALLSRIPTSKIVRPEAFLPSIEVAPPPPPAGEHVPPGGDFEVHEGFTWQPELFRMVNLNRVMHEISFDRGETEALLEEFRPATYLKGAVTERVTISNDPKESIGGVYQLVKDWSGSQNLYDQVRWHAGQIDADIDQDEVAARVYPTVSLLDKAEELVAIVSAPSIAEFDFAEFEKRYDTFVGAFDGFLDRTAGVRDPEFVKTRESLRASHGALAAAGPQSIFRNLGSELSERVRRILQELVLKGYRQRHPGMEHKAGVPAGGTLVLLYTHKDFVARVLDQNKSRLESEIRARRIARAGFTGAVSIRSPGQILAAVASTGEPLDDYVVLADFCLPYLCCDTDCSDIELEPVVRIARQPGRVFGTVYGRRWRAGSLTQPNIVGDLNVTVINLDTDLPIEVTVRNGNYSFSALSGLYRIDMSGGSGLADLSRVIMVEAGGVVAEDIVLLAPEASETGDVDAGRPATVAGTVYGRGRRAGELTRPSVARDAEVAVTNVATGAPIEVTVTDGRFEFSGHAGSYRVDVRAGGGLADASRVIAVGAGGHIEEDIVLTVPDVIEPDDSAGPSAPVTVEGTVFGRRRRSGALTQPNVAIDAVLTVVNVDTDTPVPVTVTDGRFEFSGDPGTYRIDTNAGGGLAGASRVITVEAGGRVTEDFVLMPTGFTDRRLEPAREGSELGTVVGTIFGRREREGELTRPNPVSTAEVVVTHVETGTPIDVTVVDGNFEFTGRRGTYRVETRGGAGLGSASRVITIGAGRRVTEDIILRPPSQ